MKTTEGRAKVKRVRANIQQYILDATLATGILAVSLVSPKVGKLLQPMMKDLGHPDRTNAKIKRAFTQLLKKEMLVMKEKNGKKYVEVTDKGRLKLFKLYSVTQAHKKRRWDKRWRIVIYDIHEPKKNTRRHVAYLLENYGFFKLQKSVWIYPYPCEELITLLKSELGIGNNLLYMIIEELERDEKIRKHFGLSKK